MLIVCLAEPADLSHDYQLVERGETGNHRGDAGFGGGHHCLSRAYTQLNLHYGSILISLDVTRGCTIGAAANEHGGCCSPNVCQAGPKGNECLRKLDYIDYP